MKVQGIGVARKDVAEILQKCSEQGAEILRCGGMHYKIIPADKRIPVQFMPSTPSDTRSLKNVISRLRRNGFKL